IGVQGNVDPAALFGAKPFIRDRILDTIRKAGNRGHILNLGHGILPGTPEDNAAYFFETAKQVDQLMACA
ncbi:MAG: uroporphyrinogen decarboxylase, partial [Cyanobacteria bacterium Co-bin8]|nr:uroporphyrinogen decarboxylase [Cyanobacteria bacterium Co-bin8]